MSALTEAAESSSAKTTNQTDKPLVWNYQGDDGKPHTVTVTFDLLFDLFETMKISRVAVDGNVRRLTKTELKVLQLLISRRGKVTTRETILGDLYGGQDEPELKIIDVFICKLRKKLGPHKEESSRDRLIQNKWGRGYLLPVAEGEAKPPEVLSQSSLSKVSYVRASNGDVVTLQDLPKPDTKRWVIGRKYIVVAAVDRGLISLDEACCRYNITVEEFTKWPSKIERYGLPGLRATRIQQYT